MSELRDRTIQRLQQELRSLSVTSPDPRVLTAIITPHLYQIVNEEISAQINPGVHSQWFHQPWSVFIYSPFGFPGIHGIREEQESRFRNFVSAIAEASKLLLPAVQGRTDYEYRWMQELFSTAMKKLPNTALSADKFAWIGHVNHRRMLSDALRFQGDSLIYSLNDKSPLWFSHIEDVASASISLIDILISASEPVGGNYFGPFFGKNPARNPVEPREGQPKVSLLGRTKGALVAGKIKKLTGPRYDVIEALINARPLGMTKDGIEKVRTDARGILTRMRHDPDWEKVIHMAEVNSGRYRIE